MVIQLHKSVMWLPHFSLFKSDEASMLAMNKNGQPRTKTGAANTKQEQRT